MEYPWKAQSADLSEAKVHSEQYWIHRKRQNREYVRLYKRDKVVVVESVESSHVDTVEKVLLESKMQVRSWEVFRQA